MFVQISVQQNLWTVIKHTSINSFPHRFLTRDTDIQMTFSRERCASHHLCICCHLENHLKETVRFAIWQSRTWMDLMDN